MKRLLANAALAQQRQEVAQHVIVAGATIGAQAVLKKAGPPESIRFHDLRHSCATLLIAHGVHPRVVMEILRHNQISTTMNTSAHVLPRLQKDATTKIEELLDRDAAAKEPPPEDMD